MKATDKFLYLSIFFVKLLCTRHPGRNCYSCMSLYMRWPLRNFYTFNHLVDSYKNTISEWAMGFRYENFTLKLPHGKKVLPPAGLQPLGGKLFFFPWANFWSWKNFYTWNSAHSEILYSFPRVRNNYFFSDFTKNNFCRRECAFFTKVEVRKVKKPRQINVSLLVFRALK